MHDVFISYEHESKSIADNVVSVLEANRIRCWYAPRDVIGDYATSIVEAINSCKVFVLILNNKASNSPQVLNEVEMAYKRIIEGEISIVPFKLDDENLSMAMEYYIKRLHWIDAANASLEHAIEELMRQIDELLPQKSLSEERPSTPSQGAKRGSNKYVPNPDEPETKRFKLQESLLLDFDRPVYDKMVAGKSDLAVLDIGYNGGLAVMSRLGNRPEVSKLVGVEWDQGATDIANERYASDKVSFITSDCESASFVDDIRHHMTEQGIEAFDILNIIMLFPVLKRPYKLLRAVKTLLKPGAQVFIRDIDDGLNIAFPDVEGNFERTRQITEYTETSGYRHSGRQVLGMLQKAGYHDICLEKQGLTTVGMTHEQRAALFDTYFSFVTSDLEIMCERYPDDEHYAEDLAWYKETYDDMEEAFQDDCFFFNGGFMIFTAQA